MKLNEILQKELVKQSEAIKPQTQKPSESFADTLTEAIEKVNELQLQSDEKITDLITGRTDDVQATVLAVQQADTSFKVMMQVRNKIIDAYKEIQRTGM